MKLSSIITYKNHLDDMTPLDTAPITHDKLMPLINLIKDNEVRFENLIDRLDMAYRYILHQFMEFDESVEAIKVELMELIRQKEGAYYQQSTDLYNQEIVNDTAEHILNRRLSIFPEVVNILKIRLQKYNDWKHAGLIIRPGHEDWIRELVSLDPLYLVDTDTQLLEPAVLRFNDQYRRRLRTYNISESMDSPILDQLPNRQFGFAFAYNFFNYKPIEIIEKYFGEIYEKLKPGGTLILTFNDCDRGAGTEMFERSFMCYTPGREVIARAEAIGYSVTHLYRFDSSNTWLELKKPGELLSSRGGQTLAKILYKDEYSQYTEEQIKNIRQQAVDLNIYTSDTIIDIPIAQIVELINQRTSQ